MTAHCDEAGQPGAMQLLLDLGSSRSKWLLLAAGERPDDADVGAGSLADLRSNLHVRLAAGWRLHSAVGISVASGDQRKTISDMLQSEYALSVQWLQTEARSGDLVCAYPDPRQLGVDRWVGLAGARALYPREHVIVADYGTATTVDLLAADGRHLGGWISPGLSDSLTSLLQRLQHLPAVSECSKQALLELATDDVSFGIDTRSALMRGVLHAQVGIIEHARLLALNSGWSACRIVLTGGAAQRLLPLLSLAAEWQPGLLFVGMQWLQQQAQQS